MLTATIQILAGLVVLGLGGELLVRGASTLAHRLRLTPAVIGLTVMAVGTSLPELMVSLAAQLKDNPDMSTGNIVGSNIFNIGMVLGVCGLIRPLSIPGSTVRIEWPIMMLSAGLGYLLARDLVIERLEGVFLLASFVSFTAFMVWLARRQVNRQEAAALVEAVEEAVGPHPDRGSVVAPTALVLVGGAGLWFGADLLIEGAQTVARACGVSDRVIGVSVVAAGTGLPEFVATLVAALHRKTDMAVGNVVGSNIVNILLVGGTAAAVRPLAVHPKILAWDVPWMLGISFILGPFLVGNRLNRRESFILLAIYAVYVGFLVRAGG